MRPHPRHAVIVCHPSENSFTAAIARRYQETVTASGAEVSVRDLYRMNFDPVLKREELGGDLADDVRQERELINGTDVFVLVYPVWFGAPPAMLIGYIDRVFGASYHYPAIKRREPHPLLTEKQLVSLTVSGSMRAWLDEKGVVISMRNLFELYLADIFGMEQTQHFHFDGIVDDLAKRDARMHLHNVAEAAKRVISRSVGHGFHSPFAREVHVGEPKLAETYDGRNAA